MGIGSEFFFEDKYGDIRLKLNDELFNIITSDRRESNEMMLILCTELFRELDELSNKLLEYELDEETYYLVNLIKRNINYYVINQNRMIQRIEEIEGGN